MVSTRFLRGIDMTWSAVLFDLDGTLTDSGEGIRRSVAYALEKMGRPPLSEAELNSFIGPPLKDAFRDYAGMTAEEAEEAIGFYRERYVDTGLYENEVYPGIKACLDRLREDGMILGVASSKPEPMVKAVLAHFGLDAYFSVMTGSLMDGSRASKQEVIETALRELGLDEHRQSVVYIGDRKYDAAGARACGLACIGALWGYGSFDELAAEKPLYIASDPSRAAALIEEENAGPPRQKRRQSAPSARETVPPTVGQNRDALPLMLWRVLYPMLLYVMMIQACVFAAVAVIELVSVLIGMPSLSLMLDDMGILLAVQGLAAVLSGPILYLFMKQDDAKRCLGGRYRFGPMPKKVCTPAEWVAASVLTVTFGMVVSLILSLLQLPFFDQGFQEVNDTLSGAAIPIQIFAVCLVCPICEELIFRGLVQRRIRDYAGPKKAVILSALLFGIYHMNLTQGLFAFAVGILLAVMYEKYGDLRPVLLMHIANNTWNTLITYIDIPISPVIFYGLVILVTVILMIYFFARDRLGNA